jgi:hypothetical protein
MTEKDTEFLLQLQNKIITRMMKDPRFGIFASQYKGHKPEPILASFEKIIKDTVGEVIKELST